MRPIDADALIDELSLVYDICEAEDDPYNIGVMAAIAKVKRMPTIEPKKGKWIEVQETLDYSAEYFVQAIGFECSLCGTQMGNRWSYCPNCGAKMDLKEVGDGEIHSCL